MFADGKATALISWTRLRRGYGVTTTGPGPIINGQWTDDDIRAVLLLAIDLCFCAVLDPGDHELRFRIAPGEPLAMRETTPTRRGERLVRALIQWLETDPEHNQLRPGNDFRVYVSPAGDTTIAPTPDV